jgi:hypothetical protein
MNRITLLAAGLAFGAMGSGCYWDGNHYPVEPGHPLDARLYVTWTIDGMPMSSASCAATGADTVRVVSDNLDTRVLDTDMFACNTGGGTTAPLDAGEYVVTLELDNCHGSATCTSPTVYTSVTPVGTLGIWYDGIYDLGPVVFYPPGGVAR